jgi:hypothetical protein
MWKRDVENYADYAKFTIPAICKLKSTQDPYNPKTVPTGLQFTEGMPVVIAGGYDYDNYTQFKGFIKRINFKIPLEVECEGYSYQLRKKMFNGSYTNTTVKQILQDLVTGTDIVLSAKIPNIPIPKVIFKNYAGTQVLEYLKTKCLLTVYFRLNELYVGLLAGYQLGQVQHRLNWNVIKDDELLFNAQKEFATVNIVVDGRNKDGTYNRQKAHEIQPGNEKLVKLYVISDATWRQQIANDVKTKLNNKGYTGRITAFLVPYVEPGMSDSISDTQYPERTGVYFITSVEGSIGPQGGRQLIGIGFALSA